MGGSMNGGVGMMEAEKKVFFEKILPALNEKLQGEQYFGRVLSIADVQYYSEISTILLLSSREISKSDHPALHTWYYQSMRSKNPILGQLDQMFVETLAKNSTTIA